jgi:hypothetical protein
VAAPSANRINKRAAKDKAFLARALKNPGLRAKLDPKFLSAPQRASRTLNARLNAPIVPGSSTTERDLAHEAQAAQTVRYGPQDAALGQQLGVAQQTERDTGSLYDQYRQALQQHSANISAFQAGAQQALGALQQGVTGLGQQSAVQMAQSAAPTQSAVAAPSGDLATLANQALAVRQAQAGTFGAEQALTGAAANTYADTQANVVAPGQKLGALAQAAGRTRDVRQKQADLATEKGAFNQQFRTERRADEFKNQLAMQTLGINAQKAAVDATATTTRLEQSSPAGKAAATAATEEAKQAAKYGMSTHQWRTLGPSGRANVIAKSKKTSTNSNDVITSGPLAGKTKQWVRDHSDAAGKLVDAYHSRGKKPKPGDPGGSPAWQTSQRQSAARSQVASLKRYAAMAKAGKPFVAGHGPAAPLPRNGPNSASAKIQASVAAPDDPILVTAALDAVYNNPPSLSASTVRKLIAAGYKPSLIAQALGVPTSGGQRSSARTSRTTRPGSGPATARPS